MHELFILHYYKLLFIIYTLIVPFYYLQYGQEAHVTLGHVGGTPNEVLFNALEDLVKSRDHDVIRNESRDAGKPPVEEKEEEEEGEKEEGEEEEEGEGGDEEEEQEEEEEAQG